MKEEDDEFMCYVVGGEYDKVRQAQGSRLKDDDDVKTGVGHTHHIIIT